MIWELWPDFCGCGRKFRKSDKHSICQWCWDNPCVCGHTAFDESGNEVFVRCPRHDHTDAIVRLPVVGP